MGLRRNMRLRATPRGQRGVALVLGLTIAAAFVACVGSSSEVTSTPGVTVAAPRPSATRDHDGVPQRPVTVTQAPPAASTGFYDPTTRTGVVIVDRLLDELFDGGGSEVRLPVLLVPTPCTTVTTGHPGRPPCPKDVAAGTLIEVFPSSTCQPQFFYDHATAVDQVERVLNRDGLRLFAVSNSPLSLTESGKALYGVVLAESLSDEISPVFYLSADGVVGLARGCGPPEIALGSAESFLLPPNGN